MSNNNYTYMSYNKALAHFNSIQIHDMALVDGVSDLSELFCHIWCGHHNCSY